MPKILVVEDDIDLSNLIQTVLESKGHEVFTALNGKIALETLDITNIDLIISDIMMPQMDGFLLLSEKRFDPLVPEFYKTTCTRTGKMLS